MKKLLGILLICMMMFLLVACGGKTDNNNGNSSNIEGGIDEGNTPDEEIDQNSGNNSGNNSENNSGNNQTPGSTPEPDPTPDPTPDIDPDPNIVTVYLINRAEWERVAIYYWNHSGEIPGGWPGKELSVGKDGLYRATFNSDYLYLIFNNNNNGAQTADLSVPTGDSIVYDNVDNRWLTYKEAIALLGGSSGGGDVDKPVEPQHIHSYEYELISYNEGFALEGHCTQPNCNEPTVINDEGLEPEYVYVAPTCSQGGYSHWSYTKEGHVYELTIQFEPIADNHSYADGKCEYCGTSEPGDPVDTEEPEHTHSWVEATCTTPMICSTCGETDGSANGHSWSSATCTAPKTCTACGETDGSANGHSWSSATCTAPKTCTSCGETDGSANGHSFSGGKCSSCGAADPDYVAPDPVVGEEMEIFNELFNPNNHVYIKLDISASELKKIQQDYERYASKGSKSPIYRMADMIVRITKPDGTVMEWTIEQVGVRMKGNTSRTSFYNDWDGMYNLIHFKVSFQETFDDAAYYGSDALTWTDVAARKARKDRTFATLEKIDMRWNRNDDTTYIRENYAYELYREFGVLAPHTALASTDIGKDHAGVFVIYEPIDKIFLEKNLPASALGGDLYKLGWTSEGATFTSFSSYGVEDEDNSKFYVYDLKTNKKTSDHSSLRNLITVLNSSGLTKEKFASVVDVENFMYYCAVSYIIGNPDDLRNNYNNSYIYFRPDTGKMIVIPYDMDRGLGVNTWNPTGHGMTKDDPFSKKALGNGDQRSPLFLKSVCSGGFFVNEYIEALKAVDASEMLTIAKFREAFDIAAALYSADATPSKSYNNAGGYKFHFDISRTCKPGDSKNMSFADYITAKRATLYGYIGDQGNTDNSGNTGDNGGSGDSGNDNPSTNNRPYIMGDMNGWQVNQNYLMTSNGDGTYSFTLTEAHVSDTYGRIKFKIMDDSNGTWYGYEIVDPNCSVNYNDIEGNSNGNKNFYLAPGTYVLTFNANTKTLYIEKTA